MKISRILDWTVKIRWREWEEEDLDGENEVMDFHLRGVEMEEENEMVGVFERGVFERNGERKAIPYFLFLFFLFCEKREFGD